MGSQEEQLLHQPLVNSGTQTSTHSEPDNSGHSGDSRLEKLLSDAQSPLSKRLLQASRIELYLLCRLAAPAIMVYMINAAMSLSTRIFAGHLGNRELAAASLGNSGIQLFAYGLMVNKPNMTWPFFLL
ncbi:hypothetical protein TIFTF001_019038 [Ficus carica]|uniref:Uncharacterized protein n=1 Tax=Ficus carica TaxID=3494 RepID=A0AA88ADL5_FICCA|nr:hypothetical protein TIFTF001_019038 [Ficus carica]